MSLREVITTMSNMAAPRQQRIDALEHLELIWRLRKQEQTQPLEGVAYLGAEEPEGQDLLRQVMQNALDQIDVRCHAAAVAARTDVKTTLEWCDQLLQQYF